MSDVPTTVPVCYRHPSRQTYIRCTRCDKPICPDCMNAASVGHQCPDCVAEGRRTQRPARTAFGGRVAGRPGFTSAIATKTLIGINVAVALVSFLMGGLGSVAGGGLGGLFGSSTSVTNWGAVIGSAVYGNPAVEHGIAHGEWWRLITAMFLHYGLLHLALNMYALWILGRDMEYFLGTARFTVLYLLAGLGGNVAAYLFSAPNAATAGASTAVFGLMAAIFVILKRMNRSVAQILPMIVINVIFTLFVAGISIPGHLGGLITGGAVAAILAYAPQKNRTLVQVIGCGIILVILVGLAIYRTSTLLT
jgi:membrane associated rhomboid family serine protease